jgi:hypothetical protein
MEKKGQLAQRYVEGETDLLGRPLDEERKANMMKADQARKEFDERNQKTTWGGPLGKKEDPSEAMSGSPEAALAARTYVEGETDVLGRPLDDERRANIAAADQARKEFDLRNGKKTWSGTLAKEESETTALDTRDRYEYRDRAVEDEEARAEAARKRAEFMARTGETEWLDVTRSGRLSDDSPGLYNDDDMPKLTDEELVAAVRRVV